MLSRINALPKLNSIIRHISTTNLILSKQYQVKTEPNERKDSKQQQFDRKFKNDYQKKFKNFTKPENETKKSDLKIKNLFDKPKVETNETSTKQSDVTNGKEVYNNIITSFKQNQTSYQNLIVPCQQMVDLYEQNPSVAEGFCTDPLKSTIVNLLVQNLDRMNVNEFFTSSQFILRFDSNKYERVQDLLNKNMNAMSIEQLLKTLILLRTPQLYKMQLLDTVRSYTTSIRERLDEIQNYNNLKLAMKIFSQEPTTSKKLDNKLLKLSESLKQSDWVDILNTKSIYRLRDITILELCSYNLTKLKQIDIDSIQKCLLSCGVLNYHDQQFYKFLLEALSDELKRNENKQWLEKNEKNLLSILSSIGMLQLRDEKLLNHVFNLLDKHSDMSKLVINFVTSCGGLSFKPSSDRFKAFTQKISLENFNLNDRKDKMSLLNYVWSLCSLDVPNSKLINEVLGEKFWQDLVQDRPDEKKISKAVLLKLLNINLYSMLCMDSYDGQNLPDNFSISDYTELLAPKTSQNDTLVSTLSSFRSIEKYFKVNLLTPFGIYIDALMVVDKTGAPCQLAKYFNENGTLETSENEIKVAFKYINSKDSTLINKKFNGVLMFQIKLLKELGYRPIIISQEELKSATLINRVSIVQNKLKDLVKN